MILGLTPFIGNLGTILAMSPLVLLNDLVGWRCAFMSMSGIALLLGLIEGIKEKWVTMSVVNFSGFYTSSYYP